MLLQTYRIIIFRDKYTSDHALRLLTDIHIAGKSCLGACSLALDQGTHNHKGLVGEEEGADHSHTVVAVAGDSLEEGEVCLLDSQQ